MSENSDDLPMIGYKSECLNGHTTSSSVRVEKCVHCGAAFKAHVEVKLTMDGGVVTDLLTGKVVSTSMEELFR